MEKQKQILLCVAGGTPQIITETLWALTQRHPPERVDEIRVITTEEGRRKVKELLLLDEKTGKFHQFLRHYPEVGNIKFDEHRLYILNNKRTGMPSEFDWEEDRLPDILDDDDNKKAANQICEIVQQITEDESVRVHASVAGGRKTMSLYLMAAMQLFGRTNDAMSHVLVSKEVESNPFFFYKTPQPEIIYYKDRKSDELKPLKKSDGSDYTTDDAEIFLARIPFIRLRGVGSKMLKERSRSYEELVLKAQKDLEQLESAFKVRIDLAKRLVKVADKKAELAEKDFFIYVLLAYWRKNNLGEDGFIAPEELERSHLDVICRLISKARGEELGLEEFGGLARGEFFLKKMCAEYHGAELPIRKPGVKREIVRSMAEAVNDSKNSFFQSHSRIKTALVNSGIINDVFYVAGTGQRLEKIYRLSAKPEQIEFE